MFELEDPTTIDYTNRPHVEEKIILEIKSVTELTKIHEAQLVTYLKLSECKLGLLMNFNVRVLKQGIRRIVV